MHFSVTVILTIKPLISLNVKQFYLDFTCKALHFFQSWFSVLFGKYITCYERFCCCFKETMALFYILLNSWPSVLARSLIVFSCFFCFSTRTLNLEMMELVSGTLAFLRQNPHLFMSVQDSEQTASLTGNIKITTQYIQR